MHLSGALTLDGLGDLPARLSSPPLSLNQIDLSHVTRMDTVGAWIVHRLQTASGAGLVGGNPHYETLVMQMRHVAQPVPIVPPRPNPFLLLLAQIGQAVERTGQHVRGLLGFLGLLIVELGVLLRAPHRMRWSALFQQCDVVGLKALGIIGLMSFLVGLVIAQQGALQLADFGAGILTINLICRLSMRELGVLMTAIMVAGRSGSAFAAELGTMKLNEEIDAMRTIGISPVQALILPRIIASTVMMPLLGFYAAIIAIFGGACFCWLMLNIPPITFVERMHDALPLHDIWVELIKAPVFGFIIGIVGCMQGMLVESDAEQVGLKTTAAVVQAIFLVIVLDAFFAVIFSHIGLG